MPGAEVDRLSCLALAAAKDFNDELTFILNHAQLTLDRLEPGHPAGANLTEVRHSAIRCAEIARGLPLVSTRAREPFRYATVKSERANPGDRDFL